MAEQSEAPISGACFCGAVRFEVDLPSLFCAHCHCSMCRRNHGAGFVTWFAVPYTQFRITRGSGQLRRFVSSDHGTRSFCGICGSSLFCESTRHPEHIDIVLANMESPIDRAPQMHVFFSDRAPWIEVGDSLPRLGGESGLEPVDE
jgi:hypothetical protein